MPSSTSSFSRLPGAGQGRTWLLLPVVLFVLLAASELVSRHFGFLPSLVDSPELWSLSRDQVYERDGKRALVILGASRAQTGLDPTIIGQEFPEYRVIQLSLDGTPPDAILRDLCRDPEFNGIILCSATVELLLPAKANKERRDEQYVAFYRDEFARLATRDRIFNAAIKARLQSRLAILSAELSFANLVRGGGRLRPSFIHFQANRFRPSLYRERMTPAELAAHEAKRVAKHRRAIRTPSEDRFEEFCQVDLRTMREALTARGGKLFLLRMPCSGEYWQLDQRWIPKAGYWDRIQDLSGVPTIHFADYEDLRGFSCPDGSHLDATDSGIFSRRLAHILRDRITASP